MQKGASLVSMLVLGWVLTLHGVPVLPEPLYHIQENFDLDRFMGKWYEVAVVSTCPYYMQAQREDPAIVTLELHHGPSAGEVKMNGTVLRQGRCKQISTDYSLTNTPGQFYHHFAKFQADVDSYVVHSNYDDYAMLIMLSIEKPSGNKSTTVKLYSRTMNLNSTVLEDFKTLVTEQGMTDDAIIFKQDKGECVPGDLSAKPDAQPKRATESVVSPVGLEDTESSDIHPLKGLRPKARTLLLTGPVNTTTPPL
ncbi:protein AMBP-like [Polymixia lowei]